MSTKKTKKTLKKHLSNNHNSNKQIMAFDTIEIGKVFFNVSYLETPMNTSDATRNRINKRKNLLDYTIHGSISIFLNVS